MSSLPVVGAAMTLDEVELHREWLFEKSRDLELQSFIDAEVLNGDWAPLAARARRLLDGHGGRLGIHGPFWGFTIASEDPDIRAIVTKRLLQGLDVCAAIGATHMVIHSPYTSWSYNNLDDNAGAREALAERTHMTLRDAVRRAEDIGCTMVIENIEDKDPHSRVALAESFQSPAVAVSIDTGHAHYAHGYTGAPPVDYYGAARQNIYYCPSLALSAFAALPLTPSSPRYRSGTSPRWGEEDSGGALLLPCSPRAGQGGAPS
ncbi:sugar phosphate isomerase/epimerase family protein [Rhizobium sp.]|uniref:sugar phosphate isomerase/epimerase family protein n=1 Tax=Rhizobium sp. TaxID=391 RepID=UPI00389985BC